MKLGYIQYTGTLKIYPKWNKQDTKHNSTYISKINTFIESESRLEVIRGWKRGNGK